VTVRSRAERETVAGPLPRGLEVVGQAGAVEQGFWRTTKTGKAVGLNLPDNHQYIDQIRGADSSMAILQGLSVGWRAAQRPAAFRFFKTIRSPWAAGFSGGGRQDQLTRAEGRIEHSASISAGQREEMSTCSMKKRRLERSFINLQGSICLNRTKRFDSFESTKKPSQPSNSRAQDEVISHGHFLR